MVGPPIHRAHNTTRAVQNIEREDDKQWNLELAAFWAPASVRAPSQSYPPRQLQYQQYPAPGNTRAPKVATKLEVADTASY